MSFKLFLQENDELLSQINLILDELDDDELDEFGYVIYDELFDPDDEDESDEEDSFDRADIDEMIAALGPDFYEDILDLLSEYEDDDDDLEEGVGRIMKTKNMNRKKRKFMKNSKAVMRRTKAKRKRDARKTKAKRKRYYRANKKKIAAYQKSRATAIKKGKHTVKLRRKA